MGLEGLMAAPAVGNRPLYRHLLCPVDFSDVSRAALKWALGFARETGAAVSVLHVVDKALLSVGNLVAVPGRSRRCAGRPRRP